jgi:hypothetical protein
MRCESIDTIRLNLSGARKAMTSHMGEVLAMAISMDKGKYLQGSVSSGGGVT